MKKYMLISTYDREIDSPRFFETEEEAREVMNCEFADCMGIEVPEALKKYMNDEWEDDAQITDECASAYWDHGYVDWEIFDLSQYGCFDS